MTQNGIMEVFQKNWFTELSPDDAEALKGGEAGSKALKSEGEDICYPWPGQAFSLRFDEVLFHQKSKYQDVLVFKSRSYGNVLVLDNVIQCTERDEFAYQEMLAHIPMFCHPNPKKVLIIGGGDGGILREVLKHECVESVTMCEIDEMVIDVSKKYLKEMSAHFDDPKFTLFIGDGLEFLKSHPNEFDVVITDSSDPVGPAETLFGSSFYERIKASLREGGTLASQGESIWLHLDLITHMVQFNKRIFPSVGYASSVVPTYPSGTMGYLVACNSARDLSSPCRVPDEAMLAKLRFYSAELHKAAFVLPNFAKRALNDAK